MRVFEMPALCAQRFDLWLPLPDHTLCRSTVGILRRRVNNKSLEKGDEEEVWPSRQTRICVRIFAVCRDWEDQTGLTMRWDGLRGPDCRG